MQYSHISTLYEKTVAELRNPLRGATLPWMPKVTEYLGGLRPHEVTLLCAPTGTGKTELLATIAAQLTIAKVPVFAAPVETGDIDFVARTISTIAKVNMNHGLQVPENELIDMDIKFGKLIRELPLHIAHYDNRVSIDEIQTVLEGAHEADGVRVALLDNLNFFLEVKRSADMLIEMDTAVHDLVMFAKKVPMHTILVVHPKKTDGGRVESEFDIKGSSTAVQECANIALFNRPTHEQLEQGHLPHHRELVFKKIRKRGFYANKSIWLSYQNGHYSEVTHAVQKPFNGHRTRQPDLPFGSD